MLSNHLIVCCPLVSSANTTVAQVVKNLPASAEDTKDAGLILYPLEQEMAPHSVFLRAEFHGQQSLVGNSPWSSRESDMAQQLNTTQQQYYCRLWLTSFPWGQALYKKANLSRESLFSKQQVLVLTRLSLQFWKQRFASASSHLRVQRLVDFSVCLAFYSQEKVATSNALLAKPSTIFWFVNGFLCMEITLFLCSQTYQFTYCLQILK